MYHSIADKDETQTHPYYRTATSPWVFESHMQFLNDQGYRTINLAEAVDLLQTAAPATKCTVITFDDGYGDFYRNAFPALNRHGFTATVFLPTAYIGTAAMQFNGKRCLTWPEVRELRGAGILFGSHTVTHPQLRGLDRHAVYREITDSKKVIEDNLGSPIDSFSYPFAFPEEDFSFTSALKTSLIETGYKQGVSTRIGTARRRDDRYFLRRLPINSLDDFHLFTAKLGGGYDWVHTLQYASKLVRSAVS